MQLNAKTPAAECERLGGPGSLWVLDVCFRGCVPEGAVRKNGTDITLPWQEPSCGPLWI
jgi:hypothetical protein